MVLMPGVTAVVFNDANEVLLIRSADSHQWELIGGAADPGEQFADAVIREVKEETGLDVIPERIVMVDTPPLITYPNGDVVQYMGCIFACKRVKGELQAQEGEVLEVRFFPLDQLPPLSDRDRRWLEITLENKLQTYFTIT